MESSKQMPSISAIELFCGIGGFRLACDRLGIVTKWANDINPLSCQVYAQAFGHKELHEGDILLLHDTIPAHDLLTAGFPCQPFSSAGKKNGIRDSRGTLFQEIVQALRAHSPRWFVLENVKRLLTMEHGDHFATILRALSELDYFVEWRVLNAMFFGLPQNRQRVVIVGTKMTDVTKARVSLASNYDLANVSSNDFYGLQEYDKWRYLSSHRKKFPTWGVCFKDRFYCCDVDTFEQANPIPTLSEILESSPPDEFFMDKTTKVRLQSSVFINRLVGGVHILYNQSGGARMGYTVFGTDGIAPTLTASHSRHYERYKVGKRYRRLTNKEYARLQGFSDAHCAAASVFKQYGLYGNAVPPPLVEWVISQLIFERGCMLRELEPVKNSQMSRCL